MTERLLFSNDRCGRRAYRFKKNIIDSYDCYFYDWKTGWVDCYEMALAAYGAPKTYDQAVALCTAHAKRHGWFKYLPHVEPNTRGSYIAAAIAAAGFAI